MALRVLLADESTTIKKVMQLALQDYAVDVKSVPSGIDVIEAARVFQPDIVFADVLLQKRNGYDVCADLKSDAQLGPIPVVLMWSSFMDLDEKAFAAARADGRLEKPFDVDSLRALVNDLVPKTGSSDIAPFLRFPASFAEPLEVEEKQKAARPAPESPPAAPPAESNWNMESFAELSADPEKSGTFGHAHLSAVRSDDPASAPISSAKAETEDEDDDAELWSHQDLSRFKVDLSPVEVESEEISLVMKLGETPVDGSFLLNTEKRPLARPAPEPPRAAPAAPAAIIESVETTIAPSGDDDSPFVFELEGQSESDEETNFELTSFSTVESDQPLTLAGGRESLPFTIDSPTPQDWPFRPGDSNAPPSAEPAEPTRASAAPSPDASKLDADQLERIIRSQSHEIIEAVVRKIVPALASQMIKKELELLLAEQGPERNESGR